MIAVFTLFYELFLSKYYDNYHRLYVVFVLIFDRLRVFRRRPCRKLVRWWYWGVINNWGGGAVNMTPPPPTTPTPPHSPLILGLNFPDFGSPFRVNHNLPPFRKFGSQFSVSPNFWTERFTLFYVFLGRRQTGHRHIPDHQDRFNGLAHLHNHKDIPVSVDEVLDIFSQNIQNNYFVIIYARDPLSPKCGRGWLF